MTDTTSQHSLPASDIVYRGGSHPKLSITMIGTGGVGLHSVVDRAKALRKQCPLNLGSDYVRWFDPTWHNEYEYDYDQTRFFVNGEPVPVKWFIYRSHLQHNIEYKGVGLNFPPRDDSENRGIREAEVPYGRKLVRESDACVLVYSCTNRGTFELLTRIWNELYLEQQRSNPDVPLCKHLWVVANKIDWPRADWEVSLLEGDEFSSTIGATFRYMSARSGEGTQGFGREVVDCILTARNQ